MKILIVILSVLAVLISPSAAAAGKAVATPYKPVNVVFDFYFDDPQKIGSALYWIRSVMNPLMDTPYDYSPEELNIVVVIHGTEIVTVATKNQAKYSDAVERMRYYASLGVKFKVCGQATEDYGYSVGDYQDFIEVVPNAINELAHWQMQGYALITPQIMEKKFDIEKIR